MMKRLFTTLFIALLSVATTWATDYDLWIAGTRLTSDNSISALNVPGVTGSVYYIPSSNTLNLSSAMILPTSDTVLPLYAKSGVSGLTIDVSGVCTIRSGGNIAMIIQGLDTLHIKGSGTLIVEAETYDIFFTSDYLSIEDGVSVYLIGGGLYNDGNYDETLEVNNANLFVRRSDPTWNPISMRDLVLTNAYLDSPAWGSYEWNGAELTNGDQWWYGDINIKAGTPPSRSGSSGGDVNGDGNVTLADVTKLVNIILENDDPHEYVDLGLPSGTLWAKCNIGAIPPQHLAGDFFAWGETKGYKSGKRNFAWETYRYCRGTNTTLTKYCSDSNYGYNGFTDTLTDLEPEDDAANVNWVPKCRTPSKEQWMELINNEYTTQQWVTMNGVSGMLITSRANENSIFLPAAGEYTGGAIEEHYEHGFYWARSRGNYSPPFATNLCFTEENGFSFQGTSRSLGLPIRPVRAQ